jgi:hypothetical protein
VVEDAPDLDLEVIEEGQGPAKLLVVSSQRAGFRPRPAEYSPASRVEAP